MSRASAFFCIKSALATPNLASADLVVGLKREKPVLGIVVEVQLAPDEDKRASWLVYLANLYAKIRAPVALLVIATSERVAKWCSGRLSYGHPGLELTPLVLGPKDVPLVVEEDKAAEAPELAVLSALTHSQGEHAFAVGKAALLAISLLDEEMAKLYLISSFRRAPPRQSWRRCS